ncbi:zinc ribbon domain-containing protein [Corynebacterium mastitidis]|uniref:zinc ribbon domain-containing protein n=1 Tax=Corynebacterium mastitidis TaxID=161890 RepID=UPI00254FAFD0|nr:zinc ribbon domain-containing protein [Corynebacterium mastitidis]MDK8451510.1 zinc ribbon domain-containing protein [Corynebacterium mastitidis]
MEYHDLQKAETRLQYHLTCFLLENLVASKTIEWHDASTAHRYAADALQVTGDEPPWVGTRVDPQKHKSFGRRMSRKIVCGDCGRTFGHKTWHSGTPNRVDVWECPTNYTKRGTCVTRHLCQEVLVIKMAEAMQVLAQHSPDAIDLAVTGLRHAGIRNRATTLRKNIESIASKPPANLVLHLPDFLAVLEGGCMLTDGRLGFVFITGEAVTLELPQRWSPVLRTGDLIPTKRY